MSHTNETPFLKLPQFVATDKPTWLGDVNRSYSDIDSGVSTVNNKITEQAGQIAAAINGAASAQSTADEAKRAAEAAVSQANTATGTANSAVDQASAANASVAGVKRYIVELSRKGSLKDTSRLTIVQGSSGTTVGNIQSCDITWALNEDGSYGKIYGRIDLANAVTYSGSQIRVPAGIIPIKKHSAAYNITFTGENYMITNDSLIYDRINTQMITINPDGSVDFSIGPTPGAEGHFVYLVTFPIPYYFEDFGDTPLPGDRSYIDLMPVAVAEEIAQMMKARR